ncbi:hypothetical protein [Streptomyces melanogenes]|uniref:hypothetical protein n=1 Tax=Streptomyces melanogenes TaxID=67326 RepID=UPI00167C46A0|nr:hypothetical protein [Streptomyces melanogenes]GGP80901.1 hypothetical protein GCM10010278_69320 [Streptomyces melanogenes]
MNDKPAVRPDGYCGNTAPVSGSVRSINTTALGSKYARMNNRPYGACSCGRTGISVTDQGELYRHKPPQE